MDNGKTSWVCCRWPFDVRINYVLLYYRVEVGNQFNPLPLNLDSKDLSHGPILRAQLHFIAFKSDILILGEKDVIIILR